MGICIVFPVIDVIPWAATSLITEYVEKIWFEKIMKLALTLFKNTTQLYTISKEEFLKCFDQKKYSLSDDTFRTHLFTLLLSILSGLPWLGV